MGGRGRTLPWGSAQSVKLQRWLTTPAAMTPTPTVVAQQPATSLHEEARAHLEMQFEQEVGPRYWLEAGQEAG